MIFPFVLLLFPLWCSVSSSFPQHNRFSDSDSDIKLIFKKAIELDDDDLIQEAIDKAQIAIDTSKRLSDNSSLRSGRFSPEEFWALHCAPYCGAAVTPPEYAPGIRSSANRQHNDDDISLHMNSADKDLYKFLEWTMEQLGSANSYNASGSYYAGLNMWRKNGRSRRELPLFVEEPKYIVVRREPDDYVENLSQANLLKVPFVPPSGLKCFPIAELDSFLAPKEAFIASRGKKDQARNDDEFFKSQRGKKRASSAVDNVGMLCGNTKMRTSSGSNNFNYNYQSTAGTSEESQPTASARKSNGRAFGVSCDDITLELATAAVAPSPHAHHQQQSSLVTNQAGNMNAMVSAAFRLPAILADANAIDRKNNENNDNVEIDEYQDDCTLAANDYDGCQKENDVKINGFDQSVSGAVQQIYQRQHAGTAAEAEKQQQQRNRQRRRLLSSSLASIKAAASEFSPVSQTGRLSRLQRYPIRSKPRQWRDGFAQQMAAPPSPTRRFPSLRMTKALSKQFN